MAWGFFCMRPFNAIKIVASFLYTFLTGKINPMDTCYINRRVFCICELFWSAKLLCTKIFFSCGCVHAHALCVQLKWTVYMRHFLNGLRWWEGCYHRKNQLVQRLQWQCDSNLSTGLEIVVSIALLVSRPHTALYFFTIETANMQFASNKHCSL